MAGHSRGWEGRELCGFLLDHTVPFLAGLHQAGDNLATNPRRAQKRASRLDGRVRASPKPRCTLRNSRARTKMGCLNFTRVEFFATAPRRALQPTRPKRVWRSLFARVARRLRNRASTSRSGKCGRMQLIFWMSLAVGERTAGGGLGRQARFPAPKCADSASRAVGLGDRTAGTVPSQSARRSVEKLGDRASILTVTTMRQFEATFSSKIGEGTSAEYAGIECAAGVRRTRVLESSVSIALE